MRVTEDWTPQYRLEKARQREHVVVAIVRAQSEWRAILDAMEATGSEDDAQEMLRRDFGFTRDQARAVINTQFQRVSRQERTRMSDELADLRAEIARLESEL